MKQISCGLVLTDGRFILSGFNSNFYDIPKGKQEYNETYLETCIRETKEETGLDVSKEKLIDLGLFKYLKKKDLYLFLLKKMSLPKIEDLKCESKFIDSKGKERFEFVYFKYIPVDYISMYFKPELTNIIIEIFKKNI